MGGLTASERKHLETIVGQRVGKRSNAKELVAKYLDAMHRNAFARTTGTGPVPTGLPAERSMILIEISRQLGRVIEDYEIQALMRVTPTAARTMRTTLFATYPDLSNELSLDWSLQNAAGHGRSKGKTVHGQTIGFANEDRRDAFVDYAQRQGIGVEVLHGDQTTPWKVVVDDAFPKARIPG